MRAKHTPSIELHLQPSYLVLGCYLVVSILSVLGLTYLPATTPVKILASMSVMVLVLYIILRDALLALPWSWQLIRVSATGEVELVTRKQQAYRAVLEPTSVCHPWLVVLHFNQLGRGAGYQSSIYLTPFRVQNSQQLRRLRMWMRWYLRPTLIKMTNQSLKGNPIE